MNGHRNLQVSAAVVIANGMAALTTMVASPAYASGCSSNDILYCFTCDASVCPQVPGCTLTAECVPPICENMGGEFCSYN